MKGKPQNHQYQFQRTDAELIADLHRNRRYAEEHPEDGTTAWTIEAIEDEMRERGIPIPPYVDDWAEGPRVVARPEVAWSETFGLLIRWPTRDTHWYYGPVFRGMHTAVHGPFLPADAIRLEPVSTEENAP